MSLSPAIRLDPSSSKENSRRKGAAKALKLFHDASIRVPAYKDFLRKAKIKPASIRTPRDFLNVPLTDKSNYINAYTLEQMSWDGSLGNSRYISSSSGSTGIASFWPRGLEQDAISGAIHTGIFERIFQSKKGRTLYVNSFALGTWIAGFEFYNAAKSVADAGSNVVTVTPGIDKTDAINQILKLSPYFDRIVLGGYPPFIKDIIEHGAISGIDWKSHDVRLFFAGESVSEFWKERVVSLLGKDDTATRAVNLYGMAEVGSVGHETPTSALLRKALRENYSQEMSLPAPETVLGMYQYYPSVRHIEVVNNSSLVLTARAGLPLIRYDTRDSGGILDFDETVNTLGSHVAAEAKRRHISLKDWQLPFVYLHGRRDLSISLYALNIYVENIKHALEHTKHTSHLSGLFTMSVEHTENLDQQFAVIIELARGVHPSRTLADTLAREVVTSLKALNSEYAKLHSVVGDRAIPKISLVQYGEIQTVPGRKHKWVKRS